MECTYLIYDIHLYVINFAASNRAALDHDLDSILSGGNDGELSNDSVHPY